MSVYTTQVRWILESGGTLALDSYPIFQESYRAVLNQKIIDHFYFREIGFETVGLFNNRLKTRLNEVMPYFNKLYETQLLNINPLITKSYTETFQRDATDKRKTDGYETRDDKNAGLSEVSGTKTDTETRSTNTQSNSKVVGSDTPQGLLSAESINSDLYASQATVGQNTDTESTDHSASESSDTTTKSEGSASSDVTRSGTDDSTKWEQFTRTIEGFDGTSQAELVMKFREALINVDQMVFDAIEDLFMQLW